MDFSNWRLYNKGVHSKRAPHIDLGKVDTRSLFNKFKGSFYIRYDSDFDKVKSDKYYHVIKDGEMTMESIPSKTRNMVRRCLKNCVVEKVNYKTITENPGGYEVVLSEYRRYSKKGFKARKEKTKEQWSKGMLDAEDNGQEFWAVIYQDIVIGYAATIIHDNMVGCTTWKCNYEQYNHLYPSYGLVFKMTEYYLQQPSIKYVNGGARSMVERSNVQNFLISKFNFRKAYTKLNVHFKWWLFVILFVISPFEKCINNNSIKSLIRMYKWSR
ncbi:MAG: hypothetical protein WBH98_06515 [Bacteroidales bacterium]